MDAIKINRKQARMIAHRGLSGLELENSCAAFVAAGNRDYWGIETDVHQTADGKFVIFHDDRTGRVSPTDMEVEAADLETLRNLPLWEVRNNQALRWDLRMPIPEEYFAICRRYGKIAVFELKNPMSKELVAQLVDLAFEAVGAENVVFISFCLQNLIYAREYTDKAVCQFLLSDPVSQEDMDAMVKYHFGLDIKYTQVTPELVQQMHDAGLEINCWTVDDPQTAEALVEMGVDYITSNILY